MNIVNVIIFRLDYVEGRYVSPDGDNVLPIDTLSILRQATQGTREIFTIKKNITLKENLFG